MRVTFDTNSLDRACRPERFPKDPNLALYQKVNAAIEAGQIQGFYSVTLLTIEAIQRKDRAPVFGDTRMVRGTETISTTPHEDLPAEMKTMVVASGGVETVSVSYKVTQPKRGAMPEEFYKRIAAGKALGFRVLRAVPRLGGFLFIDPTCEYYLPNDDKGQLAQWQDTACKVVRELEARDVGQAQVKALGEKVARQVNPNLTWFDALEKAQIDQDKTAVPKAFSEWADGDSIASHIAYGDIDVFCTADKGNSNAGASVLDPVNRQWLTSTYGVKFMTIEEIANGLP